MTTIKFQVVKVRASRSVACPKCGKKVKRSRTFERTLNPFNKNADGSVKTYSEVLADVGAEARFWMKQAEPCATCKGGTK